MNNLKTRNSVLAEPRIHLARHSPGSGQFPAICEDTFATAITNLRPVLTLRSQSQRRKLAASPRVKFLRSVASALAAVLAGTLFLCASAVAQGAPQLRLSDDLDRPGESYCLDVLGVGTSARADLPLVVHNCLPERGSEDRIAIERDGKIFMPAFGVCVTAFVVVAPLPGSPVILRECGVEESLLPAASLQSFSRDLQNRLQLRGTDLCLTVGPDVARTFSRNDRWRTLTMETCGGVPIQRQAWR